MKGGAMSLKNSLFSLIAIILLLMTQNAQANFRKALDAYIARDGETMLKEVRDAVDESNDDGIILFLGILKQYPNTWRSMLNEAQQAILFNSLEVATSQSSLQAQYKLALITRKEFKPPPIPTGSNDREPWYEARKQEKLKEYQDENLRLKPIANKGYAPATLQLYSNYAHNPFRHTSDIANALEWLKKAAELGNPQAIYLLGMKYLNVRDNHYGCSSNPVIDVCLPKDEAKGWHLIQKAAKHANEPSILLLDDFALTIGDFYMQGVAEDAPDYEQAYWWYRRIPSTSSYSPVWPKLEVLKRIGKLKLLNPNLDNAWGNASTWQEAVKSKEVISAWQKSPIKLPKLMQQNANKNSRLGPVFSMSTTRWYQPNTSYTGMVLDVYEDGRVNLLFSDPSLNEENDELWIRVEEHQVKAFIDELSNLKLESMPWMWTSCVGCIENRTDFVTLNNRGVPKAMEIVSATFANKEVSNPEVSRFLKVVESYFPVSKLICDVDSGNGKNSCYEIYKKIFNHPK